LSLFVDTSVWSLAMRRDDPGGVHVDELLRAISAGSSIVTTGLVLQEVLQGFIGPRQHEQIRSRLTSFPFLQPEPDDHVAAAELRNKCRRAGVQIDTIDALLAQLCLHHDLTMLTADRDFQHMAKHCALKIWKP
jgi:predicted nucleic acid-binding protein